MFYGLGSWHSGKPGREQTKEGDPPNYFSWQGVQSRVETRI